MEMLECSLVVKTSYRMKRHFVRMHETRAETEVMDVNAEDDDRNANSTKNVECDEVDKRNVKTIEDLLKQINLPQYTDLFKAEMIDLKMLMNLKSDQILEMMRDIGIFPWGHRHILRITLEEMNKSFGGEELIGTFATNKIMGFP